LSGRSGKNSRPVEPIAERERMAKGLPDIPDASIVAGGVDGYCKHRLE
jgi:hypothetical protein